MNLFRAKQRVALSLSLVATVASHAVPLWFMQTYPVYQWVARQVGQTAFSGNLYGIVYDAVGVLFGLVLVLPTPLRCGLRIGAIGANWKRVLLVCGGPLLICIVAAPFVRLPPFHMSIWLVSPLAQDLVFCGFIYAILDEAFSGPVHRRLQVNRAVFLTAAFFVLWHVPNFRTWPANFVTLQLAYTFAGAVVVGLSRQWTGSMIYITATHMAANCYTWYLSHSPSFPIKLQELLNFFTPDAARL